MVTISSPKLAITAPWKPVVSSLASYHGAADFARSIINSFLQLYQPWPFTALVFRLPDRGEASHHFFSLHIAPRLRFTLLKWHPGVATFPDRLMVRLRSSVERKILERVHKHVSVHRLAWGGPGSQVGLLPPGFDRVELPPGIQYLSPGKVSYPEAAAGRPGTRSEELYQAVPRILRRLLPAGSEKSLSKAEGGREASHRRKKPEGPQAQGSISETSLDLNQLTEKVIQAIDRRIAAQRERLGRP